MATVWQEECEESNNKEKEKKIKKTRIYIIGSI
jgi:hypothetical protein